jgi:deoxyribodipyrimidine photolyase
MLTVPKVWDANKKSFNAALQQVRSVSADLSQTKHIAESLQELQSTLEKYKFNLEMAHAAPSTNLQELMAKISSISAAVEGIGARVEEQFAKPEFSGLSS